MRFSSAIFRTRRRVITILGIALLLSWTHAASADKRAGNRAYVQSGPDGVFYARCVPTAAEGSSGRTDVYAVREVDDERLDHYDWYAPGGVTLGWSPTVGKVAVLAVIAEERPGEQWRQQEELRFAIGGKVLRSYTVGELIELGAEELVSRSRGRRVKYRVLACEQVPGTNDYDFVLEVGHGTKLKFDITTGALRPDRPRVPIGPDDKAEALRVATAYVARTYPKLDVGRQAATATYFLDVDGRPLWVVSFSVSVPHGADSKTVGVRPYYAFDVRLRPDGEVDGTISHTP